MRLRTAVLLFVATTLILPACSRFATTSSTSVPAAEDLIRRISSHCTDLDAPDLGEGKLCIDNGFRVSADDFSFANWGRSPQADANVTVQTMIDLFGHSAVCVTGPESECVLRPTTTQKLEEWNNALAGGRCEGLSTLSTRFFLNLDSPASFRTTASQVADLKRDDTDLSSSIVYWWATQFLTEVSDRAATSRTQSPLQLVDNLIQGLANGVGYTAGLYFGSSGHSVTPFAVTRRGTNFVVHVYDNNSPGMRRELLVNGAKNTWTYESASTSPSTNRSTWSGGIGTLELTPMSSRQGPFACTFCSATRQDNPTVITLASRDPQAAGYLLLTTRDGRRLEASATSVINEIDGVEYSVSKGAGGGLVSVTVPDSIAEFDVEVRRDSAVVPAGDVVVNIRRPSLPSIQVSGNLAHTKVGESKPARSLLAVRSDGTSVTAPSDNSARISIAAGSALTRTELIGGHTMLVKRITGESIEVAIKGRSGSVINSTSLDATVAPSVSEITLALAEDGEIITTQAEVAAVPVRDQTTMNFTPRKPGTAPATTVPTSIVIALPG